MKHRTLKTIMLLLLCAAGRVSYASATQDNESATQSKDKAKQQKEQNSDTEKSPWKLYKDNPVITMGKKGAWDAGALGSMTVVKVTDTYHMYYESWGVRSEKTWAAEDYSTLQIGHATSKDGIHWTKDPNNPVIPKGKKGEWDSDGTWDPFVIYEDGKFKMWYGGGMEHCDWAYAESKDGTNFTKKGRLSRLGSVEDCHVVHDRENGRYLMYYWDRSGPAVMLATSPNEMDFDFEDAEVIRIQGEDYREVNKDKTGYFKFNHVIKEAPGKWYMFYGEQGLPHCANTTVHMATSKDGKHWENAKRDLVPGHDGEVIKIKDGLYYMYYGLQGHFDAKDCDIRLAILEGNLDD